MLAVQQQQFVRLDDPTGQRLDAISDAVDELNVQKFKAAHPELVAQEESEADAYAASQFDADKEKESFRQYEENSGPFKFYTEQHTKQTVEYNLKARADAFAKPRATMSVWEAMELLDTLVDESDPDTEASQITHLLQTAEAMRKDGKPDWMQVTGLVHDLGKLLYFFGSEGQWDVVGDTFVVGAAFPEDKIVFPGSFAANPDLHDPRYNTKCGIYKEGCGLENLMLSWGHDEYLYLVFKRQSSLPQAALNMIRYHSLYPWHREGAYKHFMCEADKQALKDVLSFNPYDLYSKSDAPPKKDELKPYYQKLISKYFPEKLNW